MSTKKPTPSSKGKSKKTTGPSDPFGAEKKRKSAGFIETSGFKPNWLETGPLSPDMLPDASETEQAQLTPDEFETLQASLQRFYQQAEAENPASDLPQTSDLVTEEPVVVESVQTGAEAEIDFVAPSIEGKNLAEAVAQTSPPITDPVAPPLESENLTEAVAYTSTPIAVAPLFVTDIEADVDETLLTSDLPVIDEVGVNETLSTLEDFDAWVQPLLATDPAEVRAADSSLPSVMMVAQLWAEADTFIEDSPAEIVEDVPTMEEPDEEEIVPPVVPVQPRITAPKVKRRRDRLSAVLLIVSLLLLAAAAVIYFVNPFSRLALGAASLARPVSSPTIAPPRLASGDWCLRGDFLDANAQETRLIDTGLDGDILAQDQVYLLEYAVAQPGTYEWQVVDCADASLAYPGAPAWITTSETGQNVTFIFDSNERSDPLFFPIPYVVSAADATSDFRVIGSFQDWNPDDTSGELERISSGLYQQVRRIARSGSYEAYVIAGKEDQAIDAYGRTTVPIPFSFQTERNGDYVIFLVDTDRGRASVMYDMPPVLTSLAFGNGFRLLSLALAGLAALLLFGLIVRLMIMRNKRLQMESGCPNCGQQELMRIARQRGDRFLHLFGIPAYRYRCRNCTWEGTRLSEAGTTVSPGVSVARFNDM